MSYLEEGILSGLPFFHFSREYLSLGRCSFLYYHSISRGNNHSADAASRFSFVTFSIVAIFCDCDRMPSITSLLVYYKNTKKTHPKNRYPRSHGLSHSVLFTENRSCDRFARLLSRPSNSDAISATWRQGSGSPSTVES